MATTQYLDRPQGRIRYDDTGSGPLVVLVPGMGDLRSTYRLLAPALVAAGLRVATTDLRGHGDSDPTFSSYGSVPTADDVEALVVHLGGGPAVLVGNSMAAGSVAVVAARRPDLVRGLVLLGPFVRDPGVGAVQRALFRVAMQPLWIAAAWRGYLPSLYAGRRPDDFDAYRDTVVANLRRPGRARAFARTSRTSHAEAAARLADVQAPTVVVMGAQDPDFADPAAEARWIAEHIGAGDLARVVLVPDAGHYPQSQQPDAVLAAVTDLVADTAGRA